MELGIGTSHFAHSKQMDWKTYFRQANHLGYRYIDTSPFYSSAMTERMLGEFLAPSLKYKIVTKFGLPYYDLGTVRGKIERRVQKGKQLDNLWGSQISPKLVPRELKKSLSRLKINECYGYLMHSVNGNIDFDSWVETLLSVKEAGLVQRIGLSMDSLIEADFSWADILQIPASLSTLTSNLNFKGSVMINGFARPDATEIETRLSVASKFLPQSIGLIRSSSMDHLAHFANLVQRN
jgi:aryl-alcohol dehydrogenase-like predicted oxidoreductase